MLASSRASAMPAPSADWRQDISTADMSRETNTLMS